MRSAGWRGILAGAALAVGGCATTQPRHTTGRVPFNAGPLASRTVEADGSVRTRALGPVFEFTRDAEGRRLFAVRPFYAAQIDPASGWTHRDILWPVASAKHLDGRQRSWRVATAYYQRFDPDEPEGRWRLWVLPLYFQGRDIEGKRYAALFPVGGRIHEFLGQDEIAFLFFPLWSTHRVGHMRTRDVFWPIYSRTKGPGIHRARLFPFYGKSRHRGHYTKRFILWPLWTEAEYAYALSAGRGFILFPFYGHIRLTDQSSDLFLPPFFRFDRAERMRSVTAPWPFIRVSSGETREVRLWPIYRTRRRTGISDGYVLWPIFHRETIDRGRILIRRRHVLPFVQTETRTERFPRPGETPVAQGRSIRLWPLAAYRREADRSHFRMPAIWPTSDPRPIERSWSPLWTLVERRTDGEEADTEILWGIYRRRIRADGERRTSLFPLADWGRSRDGRSEWNLLKGLIGMHRHAGQTGIRLLYGFKWPAQRGDGR